MADPEGAHMHAPRKFWSTILFPPPPFCIRMLKNKAQIVRESIKNPRASMARLRALDPSVRGVALALVMYMART